MHILRLQDTLLRLVLIICSSFL